MNRVNKELKCLELEKLLLRQQNVQFQDQKLESLKRITRALHPNLLILVKILLFFLIKWVRV